MQMKNRLWGKMVQIGTGYVGPRSPEIIYVFTQYREQVVQQKRPPLPILADHRLSTV